MPLCRRVPVQNADTNPFPPPFFHTSSRRAGPTLAFHMLLDSSHGSIQLVQDAHADSDALRLLDLPIESVVLVQGVVQEKHADKRGNKGIEIDVKDWRLLNPAVEGLPFLPNSGKAMVMWPFERLAMYVPQCNTDRDCAPPATVERNPPCRVPVSGSSTKGARAQHPKT